MSTKEKDKNADILLEGSDEQAMSEAEEAEVLGLDFNKENETAEDAATSGDGFALTDREEGDDYWIYNKKDAAQSDSPVGGLGEESDSGDASAVDDTASTAEAAPEDAPASYDTEGASVEATGIEANESSGEEGPTSDNSNDENDNTEEMPTVEATAEEEPSSQSNEGAGESENPEESAETEAPKEPEESGEPEKNDSDTTTRARSRTRTRSQSSSRAATEEGRDQKDESQETQERKRTNADVRIDRKRQNIAAQIQTAQREEMNAERNALISGISGLRAAQKRELIVTGRLVGCKSVDNHVYAVVLYNSMIEVLIEFYDLFVDFPIVDRVDTSTGFGRRDFLQRQRAMTEKMYGAPVYFVVKEFMQKDDGSYLILGSRALAEDRRARSNFTKNKDGVSGMSVGDIVPATVISLGRHAIQVNVGGIDTEIRALDLTFKYIPTGADIADNYHVGQEILVQIVAIRVNSAGHYTCRVSRRAVEMQSAIRRHHLFCNEGDQTEGIVTGITQSRANGSATVFIHIRDYDLPGMAGHVPPHIHSGLAAGVKVRISYRGFNTSTGMTYVTIRGISGAPRI